MTHPTRGDDWVFEDVATELAAQLHRRLLRKHLGLLPTNTHRQHGVPQFFTHVYNLLMCCVLLSAIYVLTCTCQQQGTTLMLYMMTL